MIKCDFELCADEVDPGGLKRSLNGRRGSTQVAFLLHREPCFQSNVDRPVFQALAV